MERISKIKGYDEYGYEVMEFALPTADEFTQELKELGKAMQGMGITAYELT